MAKKLGTEPRKRPQQERGRQTVEIILKAASKALKSDGYDRMTTNRIAAAAGISVGTLYEYFPSKEAIVAILVERHFAEVEALVISSIRAFAGGPLEQCAKGIVSALFDSQKLDADLGAQLRDLAPLVGRAQAHAEMHKRFAAFVVMDLASRKDLRIKDLDLTAMVVVKIADTMTHAFNSNLRHVPRERAINELVDVLCLYLVGSAPTDAPPNP